MTNKTLPDVLLERGLIDKKQLEDLRRLAGEEGRDVIELIEEKNAVDHESLARARADFLGLKFKELAEFDQIPLEVLRVVPEEAASHYRFLPIKQEGSVLEVGMVDPENLEALEALKFLAHRSGFEPRIFAITEEDFRNSLKQYRSLRGEVKQALSELETDLEGRRQPAARGGSAVERVTEEAPISKVVAVILKHAVEGRASDVHIEPTESSLRVRFRVDGVLYTSLILPLSVRASVVSRVKILSDLKIDETRMPQDGRFRANIDGQPVDFRVSSFPTSSGEKVVMRILDTSGGIKKLDELGLEGRNREVFQKNINRPYGTVLVTGPTGSGKSTTLYATLGILNKDAVNIISLEDPVEYYVSGVNQSQVQPEIGYTFASGLRHVVRQDPDIIMVGEIRDTETAELAIHAALTGHVVLSTLHTNNALGVIPRLMDMKVEPFLLPSALALAVGQRLVKRLCDDCKKPVEAVGRGRDIIKTEIDAMPPDAAKAAKPPFKIYQAKGCKKCGGKGTRGRIAIFEVLEMTKELEEIILGKPTETKLLEEARRQGMITMRQDGILKALRGIVGLEEVLGATGE